MLIIIERQYDQQLEEIRKSNCPCVSHEFVCGVEV